MIRLIRRQRGADGTRAVLVVCCAWAVGCNENALNPRGDSGLEPLVVEETFLQAPLPKVDILWVVDNTASMEDEQAALAGSFGSFAASLSELGLAWQLGVVTTDVSDDRAGRLRGDPWLITPDVEDAEAAMQEAVAVGTDSESAEAGLGAAWLALSEPLRSGDNRAFRRPDATLHVVVVSDNDDHSEDLLGADPAGAFIAFLEDESAATGQPALLSAVIGDVPFGCTWDGGTALPGTAYAAVAEASAGTVASICDADLEPVLAALGAASATWPDTFPLQASPVADSVRVTVDGLSQSNGWTVDVDAPAIRFETPPAPGVEIGVRYEVAP